MHSSSIETGIQVSDDRFDEAMVVQLFQRYNIHHCQILSNNLDNLKKNARFVQEKMKYRVELSCYLNDGFWGDNSSISALSQLFSSLSEVGIKFVVTPLDYLLSNNLNFLQNLAEAATENQIFICPETSVIRNSLDVKIASLFASRIKARLLLLLAIKMHSSESIEKLATYAEGDLKDAIGIVQFQVNLSNNNFLIESEFQNILKYLYFLPFTQRPLIFTNSFEELPFVYRLFNNIIGKYGLFYS